MTELTNYRNPTLIDPTQVKQEDTLLDVFHQDEDSYWRYHCMAMMMLRHAVDMIHAREQRIFEQDLRIRQLEELSVTDELTGLKNRRGFEQEMERELARAKRKGGHGGLLLLIDLDRFKQVNDTYGHAAGDACLRLVGDNLAGCIRKSDTAARLGGDEFALLLSGADEDRGLALAGRIAGRINRLVLKWAGHEIPVSASVGVRPFGHLDHMSTIFAEADEKLYDNKRDDVSVMTVAMS